MDGKVISYYSEIARMLHYIHDVMIKPLLTYS